MFGKPSTWAWVSVHLIYPLLPFFLEGLIRLAVMDGSCTLSTFNMATLAMSTGLIAIFVNQSLRTYNMPLPDETETAAANAAATFFLIVAIAFFVLFGLLVLVNGLVADRGLTQLETLLHVFQIATLVTCVVPIVAAVRVQSSFKLRASIA